jgi:hypothetical protein
MVRSIHILPLLAATHAIKDTLLEEYFCGIYYPKDAETQGLPPCADVRAATVSNMSRPLPTLELGNASKPALFFVHGWPDSAAEFAAQFGGFCFGPYAKFRCVAVTWQKWPNASDRIRAALDSHPCLAVC